MSSVQWCNICNQFVLVVVEHDPDQIKRFMLSLLLCPIGFCMIPYVHPKLNPKNTVCPICNKHFESNLGKCQVCFNSTYRLTSNINVKYLGFDGNKKRIMGSYGQCKICGERISYKPDEITALGAHLVEKHPQDNVVQFNLLYEDPNAEPNCVCTCGCECPCKNAAYSGRGKMLKAQPKAYKTTIESWKKSANPQKCFKCGKVSIPLIRRQRHKISKSGVGAFILLGCWPLCFLPFILGGSDLMYLYCKECGNFLGMYDRKVAQPDPRTTEKKAAEPFDCGCR